MTRFKRNSKKGLIAIILTSLVVCLLAGATIVLFKPSETISINPIAFSRGAVNPLGNVVDSNNSILTKTMFECKGLEIHPDEDAELNYQVFYYDADKNFLKSTAVMTEAYKSDYVFAKYARVVITPTGAETKEEDFRISLFDVYSYAKKATINVDRAQDGVWSEIKVPINANNRIRDCVYTGEYWVMVGLNGQLTYSVDAKQWVVVETPNDGQCTGFAYGNGKYVLIDYDNGIYVSDNIYGDYECKLDVKDLGHVVYSGNEFLVVGKEGVAYKSVDGETWTILNKFTSSDLTGVIYANNQYVVVGQEGCVFVSENLTDWYDYSITALSDIRTIYYDGSYYYIGGKEGKIMVSTNLTEWIDSTILSTSDIRYVRDIVSHDGVLFAAAYTENGNGEVWVSEDSGLTWNVVFKTNTMLWICESADNKLVVGGDNGRIFLME